MKQTNKRLKRRALSGAILGILGTAQAATINVGGGCTLIDAMESANTDSAIGGCTSGSGADVIQVITPDSGITINTSFESSIAGPGDVGLPIVDSDITIEGNGMTVQAAGVGFRLFEVITGGSLTLRDTTVTGANDGYGVGSGLLSYGGQVTIEDSTFALNNSAVILVNSYGNQINNSVIRHNQSSSNLAAGLQTFFAELEVNNSSIIDNRHDYTDYLRGAFQIAGGVGLMHSEVTITNSTISGNESIYGSGLFVYEDTPPPVPSRAAMFGNSSLRGVLNSELTLTNSTITNNQGVFGAGILDLRDYGSITMQGTIVAGNQSLLDIFPDVYSVGSGPFILDAHNIIGDNGQTGSNSITLGASDQSFSNYAEDNLYPLTLSNGQLMHPLKVGSVAIDGNDLSCYGSVTDQEGKGRGKDGDDNGTFICDIGSFEHTLPIIADGAPCEFLDALASAENDTSINGCQPGNGHDIIVLPNESTVTLTNIVDNPAPGSYYNFGAPGIITGVTIEANGSTFQRDPGAVEDFDLLLVNDGGQLNLIDANLTGANGGLGTVSAWYGGNMNVLNSVISNNQSGGIFDIRSINSSVVNTTVSNNVPNNYNVSLSFSPFTTLQGVGFELRNSTISGNTGNIGAGVDLRGVVMAKMINTTISGNMGNVVGGFITTPSYTVPYGMVVAEVLNSTITNNQGGAAGGAYIAVAGPYNEISFSHSIISGNVIPPPPPRVTQTPVMDPQRHPLLAQQLALTLNSGNLGPTPPVEIFANAPYLTVDNFNIIGQNADPGVQNVTPGPSDIVPTGPTSTVIDTNLADNGGDTLTHLPVDGGDAVEGGDDFCRLITDQTGRIRPWDADGNGNDTCDIGAVEFGSIYASDIIFKDGFDPLIIVRRGVSD